MRVMSPMYLRWAKVVRTHARLSHGREEFLFGVAHREREGQGCRRASLGKSVYGNDLHGLALFGAKDVCHRQSQPLSDGCQEVGSPFRQVAQGNLS